MTPMSEGETAARAGLKGSVEKNRSEVALASETISLIRSEIRLAVTEGIREGFHQAMTEENAEVLFDKFFEVMRRQAATKTGDLVLGSLSGLAKKALWVLVGTVVLYNLGGWAALKAGWAATQAIKP